eukprot:m.62431 g.62431  ORF g.62431 m.62431 type:complete len:210 (+) comp35069_c0_seq2:37-666(+)
MEKEDEEEKRREELLSRHRQEMKELRSRILAARKDLKGDKKEKKRRLAELEKLEKELKERQEREKSEISEVEEKTATPLVLEASDKKSRAQRRKERKSAEAKERMARVLADEKEDEKTSLRRLERDDLSEILSQHNRSIYEIEPDGNCLYRAIGHQLQLIRAEKALTHSWYALSTSFIVCSCRATLLLGFAPWLLKRYQPTEIHTYLSF